MNSYSIALFLHIAGALGLFMALGLEWVSLHRLRRATSVEQVREWLNISTGMGRVGMVSMLVTLGSGFYMMATVWGGVAWIGVTLGALVLLVIVTVALTRRRMAAIQRAVAAEDGGASAGLHQLLQQPALWIVIPQIASRALRELAHPQTNPLTPLSEREREVLVLLAQGCSNREIAERLVITEGTVKVHVSNILGKLQAENRTQAAIIARRYGLA